MHREETPEFVVHKVESRTRATARKDRAERPGTDTTIAGAAGSEKPDPEPVGCFSLWDAEIDGPHAPNLVILDRESSEQRDDLEALPTLVASVEAQNPGVFESARLAAQTLMQWILVLKGTGPRGPDHPLPAGTGTRASH